MNFQMAGKRNKVQNKTIGKGRYQSMLTSARKLDQEHIQLEKPKLKGSYFLSNRETQNVGLAWTKKWQG